STGGAWVVLRTAAMMAESVVDREAALTEQAVSPYRPIADYPIIGDTRSAALVSRDGSIDWLAWPRFDSPSLFARLLDAERGGYFSVRPAIPFTSRRRYVDDTNVLETTFECDRGIVTLLDLMPVMREAEKKRCLTPFRQLLRRILV